MLDCSTTSDTPKSPLPGSSSRELLEVFGKQDNRRCVSVNDIRRAFEKAEQSLSETVKGNGQGGIATCLYIKIIDIGRDKEPIDLVKTTNRYKTYKFEAFRC